MEAACELGALVDFRLLGPVEVWGDGRRLPLRGARQRGLLGVLALHANHVVPTERLVELLWGSVPGKVARNRLRVQVHQLRRALASHGGGADRLVFHPPGYLLRLHPHELDLDRFKDLVERGRRLLAVGDAEPASRALHEAVGLWRGRPLDDIQLPELAAELALLAERRLAAVEDRIEADLRRGRHHELADELGDLAAAHPTRERLHAQLMLALYRAGRQADALAAFRRLRRRLVEELGIEPGRPLQHLQRQILAADASLDGPAGPIARPFAVAASGMAASALAASVPRELPPVVTTFTGRQHELTLLDRNLAGAGHGGPAVISAVDGCGGVGKSALAIHAAHRVADRYPDGQLYADLRGATAGLAPLDPLEVLGRFLRSVGLEAAAIPGELNEAAARFRSHVANRRLLVVLDNAVGAAQVRPLLPGGTSCGVLITSRRVLASLDSAAHLHLDVPSEQEAIVLLGRLVGARRIAAEPEAAAAVARLCGYLPLALRIAGARLVARPGWPLSALAERLADAQGRLDELALPDVGVRASFEASYLELAGSADAVDRAAAEAFGLLGILDGPDVGTTVAARLLDQPEGHTRRVLERLVDAQLLGSPAPGLYRMHDLLRLRAREIAGLTLPTQRRQQAVERALRWPLAAGDLDDPSPR